MADDNTTPAHQTLAQLENLQKDSLWIFWLALGAAVLWWAAGVTGTVALYGWEAIVATTPALLFAGGAAIVLPGVLIILAGIMAREHRRNARAGALMLAASARLLAPVENTSGEVRDFAEQMKTACAQIDRAMGHALAAMKAMASEIGDERQRLESVTYASADNARELGDRLYQERVSLEKLAEQLQDQSDRLNESIPRQTSLMVESAQAAADQVTKTEASLQGRLKGLRDTSDALTNKIHALDALASDAAQRNESLLFAIARIEEKLDHSRKTVETASRAGELAAAAAGTTGDRLLEAVKTALDGARQASAEIQKQTLEASEAAAAMLAELRDAGEQTSAALKAAGSAARVEIDRTNRIAGRRVVVAPDAAVRSPAQAEHDLPQQGAVAAPASGSSQPSLEESEVEDAEILDVSARAEHIEEPVTEQDETEADDYILETDAPAGRTPSDSSQSEAGRQGPAVRVVSERPAPLQPRSRPVEEDLFETNADRMAALLSNDDPFGLYDDESPRRHMNGRSSPTKQNGHGHDQSVDDDDVDDDDVYDDDDDAPVDVPRTAAPAPEAATSAPHNGKHSLSDIIADMEREERTHLTREETAEHLVYRLQESGITLDQIFRPKDKKKVAIAARKGDKYRRSAISSTAGRQVDRVRKRLRGDKELMMLARDFLQHETDDALNALENTHGTQKHASARLATFLLVDAALSQS